jgi:Eukaryotic aspartyl protease
MLIFLLLWTFARLALAIPTSPTLGTTVISLPDVLEKLEEHFSFQRVRDIVRRSFIPHNSSRPATLLKRASNVKRNSPGHTMPFRFSGGHTILVNISVGSPPQEVEVTLDTGSAFTWFPNHPESSHFEAENSTSWSTNNSTMMTGYVDGRHCLTKLGKDIVSLGDTSVQIPLGVGFGKGCNIWSKGILGMDKDSDFLKAMMEKSQPLLFSFTFENELTSEGENHFTMGGLPAGVKEEDIIWSSAKGKSGWFEIDMPYMAYNGERFNFRRGHKVIVDTGASMSILPEEVMERFWRVSQPKPIWPTLAEGEKRPNIFPFPLYDLTGYGANERPAMTFRIGNEEWINEIADTTSGTLVAGLDVYIGSVFPFSSLQEDRKYEISILGATFWSHLKGLVFDYTPGEERVGFVPRVKLMDKSGLLNPTFVSAGARTFGGCISLLLIFGLISVSTLLM